MTQLRKADPEARRQALVHIIVAAAVAILLLAAIERYRDPLFDWVLADPASAKRRFRQVVLGTTVLLMLPLIGLAAYLYSLGGKVIATATLPPPNVRVIRDTPVIAGEPAIARGRWLRRLAFACVVAAVLLAWSLWRLAS